MKHLTSLRLLATILLLVILALAATPLFAGGWAVVTLDTLPTNLVAGEAFSLGFMVRQHGSHPMSGLTPVVIAQHLESGERLMATAAAEGAVGHYVATLTLPSGGRWQWGINDGFVTSEAFGMTNGQPMPDLLVAGAAPALPAASVNVNWAAWVSALSLLGAAGGLVLLFRTRRPWAAGLLLSSAIVAGLSFALPSQAASSVSAPVIAANASPEDQGRALFLAKGCMMCHAHTEFVELRRPFSNFIVGPDLSVVPNTAEYLHTWLKDPTAIKPAAQMPNLELKKTEIEALVAFLKAGE